MYQIMNECMNDQIIYESDQVKFKVRYSQRQQVTKSRVSRRI